MTVLPGWRQELDGESLLLSRVVNQQKAIISVHLHDPEFPTLQESVSHYTDRLIWDFTDARKIGDGESVINDMQTFWYRMTADQGTMRQEILIYMLQFDTGKFVQIVCIAKENSFINFEEEMTKTVFSFKRIR